MAESYLRRVGPRPILRLAFDARRLLLSESLGWPGNVRQLERVVQRAAERARADDPSAEEIFAAHVAASDLEGAVSDPPRTPLSLAPESLADTWRTLLSERAALEVREAETIRAMLQKHGGVVAYAARELGVARTTLASRIEALGLKKA